MRDHTMIPALIAASVLALGACSSNTKSTDGSTGTSASAATATPADPGTSTAVSTATGDGGTARASGACALVPGVADIKLMEL